ncbi:MAG: signal recognition particle-docking protein FtsY [Gammaproteobacteria bacterium]|nr:signal recognition particle-docking protein FtsY [Gammaproteobacteria bacterium]
MFGFLRRKKDTPETATTDVETVVTPAKETAPEPSGGVFSSLRQRLSKTRHSLTDGMADLVLGKKTIDDELLEELETRLIMADVGIEATDRIISDLTKRVSRNELKQPEALFEALCDDMTGILKRCEQPLVIDTSKTPFVMLIIGINGAGKTTTIGKLAKRFQDQGRSVMLAAGDTFRAAAVEQLQTWGERNNIPVVAQGTGADSASVIFDAIASAKSRNIDIVIADTAGRLHTQANLMDELKKIKRVMAKLDSEAPHETLLVMDAGFGQNGLVQAQQFHDAMGLTGLALTKLDGTAKGGIVFAIAEKLGTPIRFIGVGEGIEDLREFHAGEFVDALLDRQD